MSYVIVHTPSSLDIEAQYGYWAVVGQLPDDFDTGSLPVVSLTTEEVSLDPFACDPIRYWTAASDADLVRVLKALRYDPGTEMDRALF